MSPATAMRIPAEPDDAELVERILLGDRAAEDRLYRRHGPQIASICSRLLRSRSEAEDALHDTFVRAVDQLHKLREPARLKPWLLQIAVSQVRAHLTWRRMWSVLKPAEPRDPQPLDALADPGCPPDVRAELSLLDA